MNNSSGLFQVDGLLKREAPRLGLEPYVEVVAHIDTETERRLVPIYRLGLATPATIRRTLRDRLR